MEPGHRAPPSYDGPGARAGSRDPQGQGRSPVRVLGHGELERREPGVATGMSARSGVLGGAL